MKQRLLTHGSPSHVRSIAGAVVVKDDDLFFLSDPSGRVPVGEEHGVGLYYHDCRFLNGYELRLGGRLPDVLAATAADGWRALFQLTNAELKDDEGTQIPKGRIGVHWERIADGRELALRETLTLQNFGVEPADLHLSFRFGADFEDIIIVRGLLDEKLGTVHPPRWHEDVLTFGYDGTDGLHRALSIRFAPAPDDTGEATACFRVSLGPQEERRISIVLRVRESKGKGDADPPSASEHQTEKVAARLEHSRERWLRGHAAVECDDPVLSRVLDRSLRDLRTLRTTLKDRAFFAAGVPWFVTLFGRDSIVACLQMLAWDAGIAADTLRLLAEYQARETSEWQDAQPGKILHSVRVGELARRGSVPFTPWYGSIDATPLFLVLLARHAAWTGDLSLFRELRENVDLALEWIVRYGDRDGDGYVEYASGTEHGLVNQGWKDSGDAIVDADGCLATPPIALVEVQAYVYLAWTELAKLFDRCGDADRAEDLRRRAAELRARFNRDFWLEDRGFYALALQGEGKKRPAAVLTSNPGHALWAGVADDDKARRTVDLLMDEAMFTGWGVRTLSAQERRYNPVAYHLGTVWPHDNAILAAGFRRYGRHAEARCILRGLVEAAADFPHHRLPEVFSGFRRKDYGIPVRYPVACHPQAWAAGAVPFLLSTLLGLEPDGFGGRLCIVAPTLPDGVRSLTLRRVRVGEGSADLHFCRDGERTAVEVLRADGVEVEVSDPVDDGR